MDNLTPLTFVFFMLLISIGGLSEVNVKRLETKLEDFVHKNKQSKQNKEDEKEVLVLKNIKQKILSRILLKSETTHDKLKMIDINVSFLTFLEHKISKTYKMCVGAGLKCFRCGKCYPGGLCIKEILHDNTSLQSTKKVSQNETKQYFHDTLGRCLCDYGKTGPTAKYIKNTNNLMWGHNRIRADNCLKKCTYSRLLRNERCTKSIDSKGCHKKCHKTGGKCHKTFCLCRRGWSGPNMLYLTKYDSYTADYCDKECPYLGKGLQNPTCKEKPLSILSCNVRCGKNGGKCNKETGYCVCYYGWTGPRAIYDKRNRINASYCNVYCPYTSAKRNPLCVNPDYVYRSVKYFW